MAKKNRTDEVTWYDPHDLVVHGIDTEVTEDHELYDPRVYKPLAPGFVRNIAKHGIKVPVQVRRLVDGTVEVVMGKRRVRAARDINDDVKESGSDVVLKVPTTIVEEDDKTLVGLIVSENEQRENNNPMERARLLPRLKSWGYDETEMAEEFGVNKKTIKNWKKLLKLSEVVQAAVEAGEISPYAAVELSGLSEEEQEKALKRALAGGASIASTKRARKQEAGDLVVPPKKLIKGIIANGEGELDENFIRGLRFAIGELSPSVVSGLKKTIRLCKKGYEFLGEEVEEVEEVEE